jgi:hypothetical protein
MSDIFLLTFQVKARKVLTAASVKIALMMEAESTSETSVNFYHTTRRNNLEDSHLYT